MQNKFLAVAISAFLAIPALAEQCQLGSRYGFIGCGPTHNCDLRISSTSKSPKLSCVRVTTRKVARTIIDPQTNEVLRVNGLNKGRVPLNASAPSRRIAGVKVINRKNAYLDIVTGKLFVAGFNWAVNKASSMCGKEETGATPGSGVGKENQSEYI